MGYAEWDWSILNKRLLAAASDGDLNKLLRYLHLGADINYRGILGETALHNAVLGRNCGLMKALVKIPEIDLNIQDFLKNTPLILACQFGSYPLVKTLLNAAADRDISGWCGCKPIDVARNCGFEDIVELIQNHAFHKYSSLEQSLTIDEETEALSQHLILDNIREEVRSFDLEGVLQNAEATVKDYLHNFQQITQKYLQIFSEVTNLTKLQQVISMWNGKHYRSEIEGVNPERVQVETHNCVNALTGIEMAQDKEEMCMAMSNSKMENFSELESDESQMECEDTEITMSGYYSEISGSTTVKGVVASADSQGKHKDRITPLETPQETNIDPAPNPILDTVQAENFEVIQSDIYGADKINLYVYEVYLNSAEELCISIIEGNKGAVEDYVTKKHGKMRTHYLEQPDFKSAPFLAGGDFIQKSAIGPGSCFTTVDGNYLQDDLKNLESNPKLSDVLTGNNTWGTLGCFAKVSKADGDELYSLSAKHVIESEDKNGDDRNMIAEIVVEKNIDLFQNTELVESVPLSFHQVLHVSKGYYGFQGSFRTSQHGSKEVDIVMLGPVLLPLLKKHTTFSPLYEIKIGSGLYGSRVKKIGVATGLTRGIVIGEMEIQGLLVVVNRVSEESVEGVEHIAKPFAKAGDSGAILLLDNDDSCEFQGIAIVHRLLSHYTIHRDPDRETVYNDVVLCVRLDYCTEALSYFFDEFNDFSDRVKMYLCHFHPNLQLRLSEIEHRNQ